MGPNEFKGIVVSNRQGLRLGKQVVRKALKDRARIPWHSTCLISH